MEKNPEFARRQQPVSTSQFVYNAALILVSLWAALEALSPPQLPN